MSQRTSVQFFFDYVDPLSLILYHRLRRYSQEGRIVLEFRPMEINPPPHPLLHPKDPEWVARWDKAKDAAGEQGLALEPPWIVPWSRKAHELAFMAREGDSFGEIHERLFRAYLIDGKDIGRVDVLTELARAGGMDPQEVKAVLDVDRHRIDVEDARAQGLRDGVDQIPSLARKGRILRGYPTSEELDGFLSDDVGLE